MTDQGRETTAARILVVEDEAILAEDLGLSLENLGYLVRGKVSTGEEAVKLAEKLKPDLILMDIKLQGNIDGIEAADQIRKRLDIPVVYLTGYSESDVLERAKKTEPYGYLGKPISLTELRSTIETALYKHRADKQVRESEERLRSILDNLHDLLFVLNQEGVFTDYHIPPNLQSKLYQPPGEFIGKHYKNVLPQDVSPLLEAAIDSLEQTEVSQQFDYSMAMADGLEWFSAKVSKRQDIRGRFCGVIIVCRDITERKKAERDLVEREALIRSISDNLPSGMIYQVTGQRDGGRQFTYLSKKVRDFYGCSPEEAIAEAGLIYGRIHPEDRQRVFLEEEKALESLSKLRTEVRMIDPSGDVRWSYFASSPKRLEDGSIYWSGLEIDITERKRAEEALRESEQRFRSLIEQASDALFVHDLEGKFLEVNQQASIWLGYSLEELLSMSVSDIDPDIENRGDRAKYWVNLPATFEARLRRKDGTTFPVEIRLGPIEYGETKVVLAMVRDITDRKMTEKALKENEDRCRTIFQTSPDAISITRLSDRVYVEINDSFTELTGFTRDEVIGKTSLAINVWNDPSDRDRLVAGLRERGQVTNLEAHFRLKDGRVRTGLMSARTIYLNGEPHVLSVTRDVEDLQKVEEELRQKTSLLNSLIEALPDSVYFKDKNRRHRLTNKAYEDFFGLSRQEAVGKTIEELVTSNSVEQSRESDEAVIETKQSVVREHCWVDQRSEKHIFETRKFPILDAEGEILAIGGISRDITERKRLEENLRGSEARLLDLYENAPNAYFSVGTDGLIRKCNKAAEELLGYPREMLEGKRVFDLYVDGPEGKEKAAQAFQKFISGEQVTSEELQMQKADGSPVWINLSVNALRDAEGRVVESRSIVLDISERKKAEELIKASLHEKEVLLREIHHRVKNNLAVIQSLLRIQSHHVQNEELSRIFAETQHRIRSMALGHELLYQSETLSDIKISQYLGNLLSHLRDSFSTVGQKIEIKQEVEEFELGIDQAVPLGFIVTELISNCYQHAFPERRRGEIRVSLRCTGDEHLELMVKDDGIGLPEEMDVEKPKSLGYHLVGILVRQLKGKMEITRQKGTEVRIKFAGRQKIM